MKHKLNYITDSAKITQELGEKLARGVLENRPVNHAVVIGLEGDLGSGKTTFLQGFARGLGIKEKVLSPTFVILKRFRLNNLTAKQFSNFYHIDCYRIAEPREIMALGLSEIILDPRNIVAIEWYEKLKKTVPVKANIIKFKTKNLDRREIRFVGFGLK